MFQDMMMQLGAYHQCLAKVKDKPPSASNKEAGCSEANDVSHGETKEPSEEIDTSREPIFEVSEPIHAFLWSVFCKVRPADNKTRRTCIDDLVCWREMREIWTTF